MPIARLLLSQNFPNPFNASTSICYNMKEPCRVILKIFDVSGREVTTLVDGNRKPGEYSVQFDASGLPSGIYVYRILMNDFTQIKKMVVFE